MVKEFQNALQKARFDLTQIEVQQRRLAMKKAQLLKTIEALAPLVTEQPSQESLSLADAMRTVMGSYEVNRPGTFFTPKLVRDLLREMGFDLSPYKNHMASIHTAMSRMQRAGELESAKDGEFEGGFRWKGQVIPNRYAESENILAEAVAHLTAESRKKK